LVVGFGHRFPVHRDGAGLALGTTSLPAGEELVAIDRRSPIALGAG
jgi:hypothetical protein